MPLSKKISFTAKVEIPGLSQHREMNFEVIGKNYFYQLSPLYKEGEEPLSEFKDIFFNRSWMARNSKNQEVVDWVKSIFNERGLSLPD